MNSGGKVSVDDSNSQDGNTIKTTGSNLDISGGSLNSNGEVTSTIKNEVNTEVKVAAMLICDANAFMQ